ncbi:WbqC family protein [Methylobacterium sp. 77]|uniref:WbqC family protein n=1 Tax=Methylobacterium sp. 77 TaxID=1101192 RepID=UPI000381BEA9|nr:WbqC family protein [Methylobacterium sp. 77]
MTATAPSAAARPSAVAIMQPYLFPYIGYFQLIAAVDEFVIYDTAKYTKKGWINRNRYLRDGEPIVFTLPLEKDGDHLDIRERRVAASYAPDRLCAQIAQAYRRAPHVDETMPLVESALRYQGATLFDHLRNALVRTCAHLGIDTPIRIASEIEGDTDLRCQDRVLGLCERLGATSYINPIGGTALYDPVAFARRGIALRFLRARPVAYDQGPRPFVPWLSIIDVMMFTPRPSLRAMLTESYDLLVGEGPGPASQSLGEPAALPAPRCASAAA